MIRSCLHTHTTFCDGAESVEAMCQAAFERSFHDLGFSSHAPLPLESGWHMKAERLENYVAEVLAAKKRWKGRLGVWLGLEIDYIEGITGPASGRFTELPLDFTIGSVHYLVPPNGSGIFTVDGPCEEFEKGLAEGFSGDIAALIRCYWSTVRSMARAGGFDIVGHLDLVKKNNKGGRWFDEAGDLYREEATSAIREIGRAGLIVEVNTGGQNRGATTEPYPAPWMLRELGAQGVRTMVNADAHRGEHLGGYYGEAEAILREAGYRETAVLTPEGWALSPL